MLLAEELALVVLGSSSGRQPLGSRSQVNAALAGLLVVELVIAGAVGPAGKPGTVAVTGGAPGPSPALAAAARVVAAKGPKVKAILSAMDRGLDRDLGTGTWGTVVGGLVGAGAVSPASGGLRPRHELLDPGAHDAVLGRLRTAAAGDEPMDLRTAAVLSMTGPAQLLEVVAPDRSRRRHARRRIDSALDATQLQPVAEVVRRVIADAAATVAATTAVTGAAAAGSG